MPDSEREYVDLLFRASKKYASWDPEIPVEAGDWGRITNGRTGWAFWRRRRGTFLKEGNIFDDGKAAEHNIRKPKEYGADSTEGVSWIVSENVTECDINTAVGGCVLSNSPASLVLRVKSQTNACLSPMQGQCGLQNLVRPWRHTCHG